MIALSRFLGMAGRHTATSASQWMAVLTGLLLALSFRGHAGDDFAEYALPKKTIYVPITGNPEPIGSVVPQAEYRLLEATPNGYIVVLGKSLISPPLGYIRKTDSLGKDTAQLRNTTIEIRPMVAAPILPGFIPFREGQRYPIIRTEGTNLVLLYENNLLTATGRLARSDCTILPAASMQSADTPAQGSTTNTFILTDTATQSLYGPCLFIDGEWLADSGMQLHVNADNTFAVLSYERGIRKQFGPYVLENNTRVHIAGRTYTVICGPDLATYAPIAQEQSRKRAQAASETRIVKRALSRAQQLEYYDDAITLLSDVITTYTNALNLNDAITLRKNYAQVIANLRKAKQLLAEASKAGKEGRADDAFSLTLEAAKLGSADAQRIVGHCYRDGYGVHVDMTKAFEWYALAEKGGDVEATHHLGICYFNGQGTAKDEQRGYELVKAASDAGYAESPPVLQEINSIWEQRRRQRAQQQQMYSAPQQGYVRVGLLPNGVYRFRTVSEAQSTAERLNARNEGTMDAYRESGYSGVIQNSAQYTYRYKVIADPDNPGYFLVWPR